MNLKQSLEGLRIKMLDRYSRETLLRTSRRITCFSSRDWDMFNLDSQQIYNYYAKQLENGRMKKSLRLEIVLSQKVVCVYLNLS